MNYPIFEPISNPNHLIKITLDQNGNNNNNNNTNTSHTTATISYDNLYSSDWRTNNNGNSSSSQNPITDQFDLLATDVTDLFLKHRCPTKGSWTFTPNSEYDLVLHVQKLMSSYYTEHPQAGKCFITNLMCQAYTKIKTSNVCLCVCRFLLFCRSLKVLLKHQKHY